MINESAAPEQTYPPEQETATRKRKPKATDTSGELIASTPTVLVTDRKALRDEFAKAALTGLLAHHGNFNLRSVADAAYQYADFMLDIRDDSSR